MNYHKRKFNLFIGLSISLIILTNSSAYSETIVQHFIKQDDVNAAEQNQYINFLPEILAQINQTQLSSYIKDIQSFGPHPTGSTKINELKNYLYQKLDSFSIAVTNQSWVDQEYSGENIIATFPGTSSNSNLVLICAHYDTVKISPGADDDGSGIASVLTIASILSKYSFNNTIQFILFSGEEQGCLGSNAYVKDSLNHNINIVSVLALDKIGYAKSSKDGSIIRHHADPASSWMIDLSENLSKQYKKQIGLDILRLPFDASSDHRSFNSYDISGSNLVEHALNPYYHTSEDTLDKINITYLQKVTKLATAIIYTIANGFSKLTNDDIDISILGKKDNPYNARLSILINNKLFPQQIATLSISIEMNHLFQNKPVEIQKEFYTIPCVWHFIKEINETWTFHLGPQTYSKGFFSLKVSVHGLYNDFPVSKTLTRYGLIFPAYNLILFPI